MDIKKHVAKLGQQPRRAWYAFVRYVQSLPKRFIKRTVTGKRYLTLPLPSRKGLIRLVIVTVGIALVVTIGYQLYLYFGPHSYAVNSAAKLLPTPSRTVSDSLTFDSAKQVYSFKGGTATSDTSRQTDATPVTATLPVKASSGITVTDPTYSVDLGMTPKFALADGKQSDGAQVVYPFRDHTGWLVYTAQGTGVKEDVVLDHESGDVKRFSYDLSLPNGTEARLESDGSIGVYGNELFMNNVATSTASDAALLEKARANAQKTLLLFTIPKPSVLEATPSNATIKATYELNGNHLTVIVSGLAKANYPLSIDPSIYVVTAQQFMNGNNETNIDFDVANKVIKKGATTGARFDSWTGTLGMNITKWKQGVAVAGGYIYTVGGVHPNGGIATYTSAGSDTFVVPTGITSITVKTWGAGGGGGGGGSATSGGNGGAGGGGGFSSVARGSTRLIIAAGGAGGGGGGRTSGYTGGAGGAGGDTLGQNGVGGTNTGGGYGSGANGATGGISNTPSKNTGSAGTSLQGGAGADGRSVQGVDGSANNGGVSGGGDGGSRDANTYYAGAGGGGGGLAGGGGGSDAAVSGRGAGGGGGGSSYTTGTGGSTTGGNYTTPGNDTDADRASAGNAGTGGGTRATGTAGASGIVVITYVSDTGATDTVEWAHFNTSDGTIESTNPGNGVCSGWCTSSQYNLPAARGKFSLVAYNGFLYAIGGEDASCTTANGTGDGGICKTVYVAKIGANGEPQLWHPTDSNKSNWVYWYRDTDLSSPRSAIKAVAYNNRLYLMGGLTSSGGVVSVASSTQIADITPDGRLGSWSSSTALPYADYNYSAVAYNDRLYLIGGASSIGGAPLAGVYYNKINADGTLNSWQHTNDLSVGRMSNGGDFGTVWGGYIYASGGCIGTNSSGYCTNIASSTQLASINADGSVDVWNTNASVNDARTGQSLVAWQNSIYEVGGCSSQDAISGSCGSALSDIKMGTINQDGEASTVADSVASGTAPCSGTTPQGCDLPGTSYIGNVLTGSAIMNGYLYIWGGCDNATSGCANTSQGVIYTAIGSDGSLTKPASCGTWASIDSYCYDATSFPYTNGVGAPASAVANGYIYSVGGFYATSTTTGGMVGRIYYAAPDPTNGSISSWSYTDMTSIGATDVSYPYSFTRANPASASTVPNNLYILGGCINATGVGCPASASGYTDSVYKCNLNTTGVPSACTKTNQLQIGTVPGASSPGLGAMAGTIYANYIYLMGGLTNGNNDLKTTRYAKVDNNNNIVPASGTTWVESPNQTYYGRRRGAGFGYNGYLYVVGGYDGSSGGGGVLADIEFAKINVSDGSIGTWSISSVNINQRWGLNVTVSNSFAYVVGGCILGSAPTCSAGGQTNSIQTFQVYNNDSGAPASYSTASNLSAAPNRIGTSATVLNGYMYVAGGCTSTTDCTNAISDVSYAPIDPYGVVGSWTSVTLNGLPQVRTWGKLLSAGGTLYYIGGQDSGGTAQSTIYYTTPAANGSLPVTWATASNPLPSARSKFGATSWNNRLYVISGIGTGTGCTGSNVCSTVYVSPQLNSGGNISSAWTSSTNFNVARSGAAVSSYANNLYVIGGYDGTNYLGDVQYAKIDATTGLVSGSWQYSTSLPNTLSQADSFVANGYIYLVGGRSDDTVCSRDTLIAPISANTTVSSGNNPTGVGDWYATNQRFTGVRYGNAAAYYNGKAYVVGGGCGTTITYASPAIQQTTLLSQPQVAKYSIMFDTDSDVFPNYWLMNGVDNSVGARWQLNYRSMANQQTATKCATMTTWGQTTNFGNITLGTPGTYTVKDGSGTDISCGRYFYFNVTVDSSQAFGYPDDVTRGPTISDLTLQFTADPSKRLMHGRTFTGGLQMPDDTQLYTH